jgi:hypothetical protein
MPQWLSISIGLIAGFSIIAGAIFIAVRPYLLPTTPKSRMPDPSDNKDEIAGWGGWSGWSSDGQPPPGDGGAGQ